MSPSQSENTKRIAKNTLMLYGRMLIGMLVSLYTSRLILHTLGVEDYGINNVVGGVVSMFSLISNSLSASVSRFLTFELGRGDLNALKRVFSTSLTIHVALAVIIVVLTETIGLWFLNTRMTIPSERLYAANWVFHASLFSFVIGLISVPFNASIVSHEKMSAFAYIGILDIFLRLFIVLFIAYSPWSFDRLIVFSLLSVGVSFCVQMIYWVYCKRHFVECRFKLHFDKSYWKSMSSFAGWNFIGASSAILRDQGGNIAINIFCGPAVNAARGIACQVNSAINGFVGNFMVALNPQITKSFAAKNYEYMMTLIYKSARFSFYILLLLSLPVIINADYILVLWLKTVPDHTGYFLVLVLIFAMSEAVSNPLVTAMLATGKIRNYQLVVGGLQMLNLPISYMLLKYGFIPEVVFIVAICLSQCCLFARLYMLRRMIGLSAREYIKKVYLNVWMVALVSSILPCIFSLYMDKSFITFILSCIVSIITTGLSVSYVGCNNAERHFILVSLRNRVICHFK